MLEFSAVYTHLVPLQVGIVIIPHEVGTVNVHLTHKETEGERSNNLGQVTELGLGPCSLIPESLL